MLSPRTPEPAALDRRSFFGGGSRSTGSQAPLSACDRDAPGTATGVRIAPQVAPARFAAVADAVAAIARFHPQAPDPSGRNTARRLIGANAVGLPSLATMPGVPLAGIVPTRVEPESLS